MFRKPIIVGAALRGRPSSRLHSTLETCRWRNDGVATECHPYNAAAKHPQNCQAPLRAGDLGRSQRANIIHRYTKAFWPVRSPQDQTVALSGNGCVAARDVQSRAGTRPDADVAGGCDGDAVDVLVNVEDVEVAGADTGTRSRRENRPRLAPYGRVSDSHPGVGHAVRELDCRLMLVRPGRA